MKILVNNSKGQIIYDNYMQIIFQFETSAEKIRKAEKYGTPLIDMTTGGKWYVDKLFEGKKA